jgi:transcriptional repressor NrdR
MKCPYCGSIDDRVVDSRSSREDRAVRRRRECLGCGKRFTTYEYVEPVDSMVIKKDGRREAFQRDKLKKGIMLACTKRDISMDVVEKMVEDIEEDLFRTFKTEIDSRQIGERVMERLENLDAVAYVRFASVYRDFKDSAQFLNEIKHVLEPDK